MKKLLCIAFAAICLCACSGGKEAEPEIKTMSCKMSNEANGLKTEMVIDMGYEDTTIVKQNQKAVMTAESKELYDEMLPTLKAYSKEDEYAGMKGVKYSLKEDEATLSLNEEIVLTFDEMSAEDYKTVSGDSSTDISKMKIDLDKTKEKLEKQGFTCTK